MKLAFVDEIIQRRTVILCLLDLFGIDQDQAGDTVPSVPTGSGRELISHPLDRLPDYTDVAPVGFVTEVTLPARLLVQPLQDGAHEGEVPGMQTSGGAAAWTAPPFPAR